MRSSTLFCSLHNGFRAAKPVYPARILARSSSTNTQEYSLKTLEAVLRKELMNRPASPIRDYLSPTNSHLLNISLGNSIPKECYPRNFVGGLQIPETTRILPRATLLPQGHHLVYFPPLVRTDQLLPDGTDLLHSPGPPWVRRMWAGGSLEFNDANIFLLRLGNRETICTERISDVVVKGTEGDEKVFITIERTVSQVRPWASPKHIEEYLKQRTESDSEYMGVNSLVEKRNLVFMRQKTKEAAREDARTPGKIVKPNLEPDFSFTLTPSYALLFRFSALTFNAHWIHLDPRYCREIEGYRNLLVHGPLTVVLMLSALRAKLHRGEMVLKLDYRNLAPLYAEEEMRVCVRRDPEKTEKFDVWIEGKEGGYAVKGTAIVGILDPVDPGAKSRRRSKVLSTTEGTTS